MSFLSSRTQVVHERLGSFIALVLSNQSKHYFTFFSEEKTQNFILQLREYKLVQQIEKIM